MRDAGLPQQIVWNAPFVSHVICIELQDDVRVAIVFEAHKTAFCRTRIEAALVWRRRVKRGQFQSKERGDSFRRDCRGPEARSIQ